MDLSEINITKTPDIDNIQWYLAKMFENVFTRIPTNSYVRFLLVKKCQQNLQKHLWIWAMSWKSEKTRKIKKKK